MEISKKISDIIKCFVDTNLETNEKYPYNIDLPEVSFSTNSYDLINGEAVVQISIDRPSEVGMESVSLVSLGPSNHKILDIQWNIGEQNKTVTITQDYISNSYEIGITNLSGVLGGEFLQAKIVAPTISESTERLPKLSILRDGDNLRFQINQQSNGNEEFEILAYKTWSSIEERRLGIARDSSFLGKRKITWNEGVTDIDFSISEFSQNNIGPNSGTALLVTIQNPKNILIEGATDYEFNIQSLSDNVIRRFSIIDLHNIFIQKGGITSSENTQSRKVVDGTLIGSPTNDWLVELGTSYQDETINPQISEDLNYDKYPNYFFGTRYEDDNFPVFLVIENIGEVSSEINGSIILPNQSKEYRIYRDDLKFTLPSNSTIIRKGKYFGNELISQDGDAYAETKYKFYIRLGFPKITNSQGNEVNPHGFTLRNATTINGDTYEVGSFNLKNFSDQYIANDNILTLTSYHRSIRTTFDGSCTQSFDGENKVKNIKIQGLLLLDDNPMNESNTFGHTFELNRTRFSPICQSISNTSNGNPWSSIEYQIYDNPDI